MNTDTALRQTSTPGIEAIKAKQKATWEDGDYANFAKFMQAGAIEILNNWKIARNATLLDVGCGAGQTAIPAAKNGIKVTGIDIAENLIQHARKRADDAGLEIRLDVGDAEDLPYSNNSFDVVISMIGAMFAPRPESVASEFARVLKSDGKLFMANWTTASMPAKMFKCVSGFVPPPPGLAPPVLWGDEETVEQRLSNDFTDIKLTRKIYPHWHYSFDAAELVNLFRAQFGPVKRAFDTIDQQQQKELRKSLEQIYFDASETTNGVLTITNGEYLEVVATRR
jgi:ubiquinone/menaquinone biosynthesis C-methylase UbiE